MLLPESSTGAERKVANTTPMVCVGGEARTDVLSEKDCRCFFDQLALPSSIQPWTGRPPVTIAELVDIWGLTLEEIGKLLDPPTRRAALM